MTGTPLVTPARNVSRARRATVVTMLVALAIVIATVLALRGPGTRSASSHAADTNGAFENGWSTRTGGNLTSAGWRTQATHVGDTTGAVSQSPAHDVTAKSNQIGSEMIGNYVPTIPYVPAYENGWSTRTGGNQVSAQSNSGQACWPGRCLPSVGSGR